MSRTMRNGLLALFIVWHAVMVWGQWNRAAQRKGGADFASYYYAVKVAKADQDPYRKVLLNRAAQAEQTRVSVHPFFYPPPFLLVTSWVDMWPLQRAYQIWFWLDELFTVGCALILMRWWRALGPEVPVLVAASIAVLTAVPNNHIMGQANFAVLFLVLLALWQEEEGREGLAGISLGIACMMKMSPALFVAWWILRWRWRPALAACFTAVILTMISMAIVQPDFQLRFYTAVLPRFANGNYNGLAIPIDMFGNHSIPNVLHQLFPGGKHRLSPVAQDVGRVMAGLVVGGGAVAFWAEVEDKLRVYAQLATVGIAMLLIPVYTYEHHLIWAVPAVVIIALGLIHRRLPMWAAAPFALAVFAWAFELSWMKPYWVEWRKDGATVLVLLIQEAKFVSLLVFAVLAAVLGRSHPDTGGPGESQ